MKAALFYGASDIRIEEVPKPQLKTCDVLIKVKRVGICGTDLHIYKGGMEVPLPLIMGHEFSGEIAEIGPEAENLKIGDKVVAEHVVYCGKCFYCLRGEPELCINPTILGVDLPGALAEYIRVPANLVYKLPSNMDFDDGVLVEPLSIAVYAVRKSKLEIDYNLAVIGQGPIGLFIDAVARAAGANIIGIDILDHRLDFAKKKKFVDYTINPQKEDLLKRIQEICGADGTDLTFEVVGQEITAQESLKITRKAGQIMLLGVFEKPASLNIMDIVKKELEVSGSWTCAFAFAPTIDLMSKGKIDYKGFITHRYPFSEVKKAFEDSLSYSEDRIKTIIKFD